LLQEEAAQGEEGEAQQQGQEAAQGEEAAQGKEGEAQQQGQEEEAAPQQQQLQQQWV